MSTYRTPSTAELYSLEQQARRMQQREIGRLLRQGASALKAAWQRAVTLVSAKEVRHA